MKTVLQINAIAEGSSTGRTTRELGEFLKKHGYKSLVAASANSHNNDTYLIGNKRDHKLHALLSRLTGLQGYFSSLATYKLLEYIKTTKPDIVHLRNLHANYLNIPLLLSFLADNDIPTVITLHDCWFYTGKCCHYTTIGCLRWKTQCNKCPKLRDDNCSWIFDRTRKMQQDKKYLLKRIKYLAVVGVSNWITKEARESNVFKETDKILRIYNWIDLQQFQPRKSSRIRQQYKVEEKFIILSVASGWSNKKGLNNIFELATMLPENFIILLVGECNYKGEKPVNVIMCGQIADTNLLAEYYSTANVYLNMSREESFGKVSAEAIACGTPVIAINSTANGEIVGPGCGYVLEELDNREILKYIHEININGKERYSSTCTKWARDNFSMENNAMEYIELYEQLTKKRRAAEAIKK